MFLSLNVLAANKALRPPAPSSHNGGAGRASPRPLDDGQELDREMPHSFEGLSVGVLHQLTKHLTSTSGPNYGFPTEHYFSSEEEPFALAGYALRGGQLLPSTLRILLAILFRAGGQLRHSCRWSMTGCARRAMWLLPNAYTAAAEA